MDTQDNRIGKYCGRLRLRGPGLILTVIVLAVATAFVLTRNVETGATLTLGEPTRVSPRSDSFQPVDNTIRQQLLQDMAEFRAQNKQLQPDIQVSFSSASEAASRVADNLNTWLNRNQLQTGLQHAAAPLLGDHEQGPIAVYHAPKQIAYAQEFARCLSPYINGRAVLYAVPELKPGQLWIVFPRAMQFGQQGQVVFADEEIG